MSETDLALSCEAELGVWPPAVPETDGPRGGDPANVEAKENEGRDPAATLLSARDLSCSDQLKPWSVRAAEEIKSEGFLD
jgi:hypothetical protein